MDESFDLINQVVTWPCSNSSSWLWSDSWAASHFTNKIHLRNDLSHLVSPKISSLLTPHSSHDSNSSIHYLTSPSKTNLTWLLSKIKLTEPHPHGPRHDLLLVNSETEQDQRQKINAPNPKRKARQGAKKKFQATMSKTNRRIKGRPVVTLAILRQVWVMIEMLFGFLAIKVSLWVL